MKQQDIEYIKKICSQDLNEGNWMARAQVMLKNIKPLKEASLDNEERLVDVPMEALEIFLFKMVRKYEMSVGTITTITDRDGEMTYHSGIFGKGLDVVTKRPIWLFTVHSKTIYETYVKLVLMSFVSIKEGKIDRRVVKRLDRRK